MQHARNCSQMPPYIFNDFTQSYQGNKSNLVLRKRKCSEYIELSQLSRTFCSTRQWIIKISRWITGYLKYPCPGININFTRTGGIKIIPKEIPRSFMHTSRIVFGTKKIVLWITE